MKKLCLCLLAMLPAIAFSNHDLHFVIFHYNIKSIGNKFTNAQCDKYFDQASHYNIVNDIPVYKNKGQDSNITYLSYHRLTTTHISHNLRLFYGKTQIRLNNKMLLTEDTNFLLNISTRSIRGSFYIPHYCTGNIIGVQQKRNTWRNTLT